MEKDKPSLPSNESKKSNKLSDYSKGRLKESLEVVMAIACHDFERKAAVSGIGDDFDGLNTGLNMLGEELKASTVSKGYLDDIFNSMTEMLIVSNSSGVIKSINKAAQNVLGFSNEEFIQKDIKEIVISQDKNIRSKLNKKGLLKLLLEKGSLDFEASLFTKNEDIIPVEISMSAMSSEKSIVYIIKDISERIKAQKEQNKLLKNLQETNKELRQFAYIISHDMKAPLRGISTLSNWIYNDNIKNLDQESTKNLKLLMSRTTRLFNFIEGVFKYSKVGRENEDKTDVDLNALVSEIKDSLGLSDHVNIKLDQQLPLVRAAKVHMTQLFQNLISNSIQHAKRQDVFINIGYSETSDYWQLYVKDNGPGIPKRHHERIFQMFQTLVPRDTMESTGIGLNIVKKIIDIYDGSIWIESESNSGCNFMFTLSKKDENLSALRA